MTHPCYWSKKGKEKAFTKRKDTASDVRHDPNIFNRYINPGERAIWSEQSTKIHCLHAGHKSIKDADPMSIVWKQFENWVETNTKENKAIILVAWNGATCDLKWLWRLTQAPFSIFNMPKKIAFFGRVSASW